MESNETTHITHALMHSPQHSRSSWVPGKSLTVVVYSVHCTETNKHIEQTWAYYSLIKIIMWIVCLSKRPLIPKWTNREKLAHEMRLKSTLFKNQKKNWFFSSFFFFSSYIHFVCMLCSLRWDIFNDWIYCLFDRVSFRMWNHCVACPKLTFYTFNLWTCKHYQNPKFIGLFYVISLSLYALRSPAFLFHWIEWENI